VSTVEGRVALVTGASSGTPGDADLAGMMRAQEVADAVVHAVTRSRTHRALEATILPMSDDSMN
jgi:NADP-dependent 3-hydroxy acid dehydrogenase YdfG